jgi:hypothetical protein
MTKRKQVVDPNQVINLEDPMTQDESRLKLEARVNRPKHHHALPIDSKYFRSREEEARVDGNSLGIALSIYQLQGKRRRLSE